MNTSVKRSGIAHNFCVQAIQQLNLDPITIIDLRTFSKLEPQSYETQSYKLFSQPKGDFTKHAHNHAHTTPSIYHAAALPH